MSFYYQFMMSAGDLVMSLRTKTDTFELDFRSSTVPTPALVTGEVTGEVENISGSLLLFVVTCLFSAEGRCSVMSVTVAVILVKYRHRAKTRVFRGAESTPLAIQEIGGRCTRYSLANPL